MKKVLGGNEPVDGGGLGPCNMSCGTGANISSCSSTTGDCERSGVDTTLPWIKCDGKKYDCPVA